MGVMGRGVSKVESCIQRPTQNLCNPYSYEDSVTKKGTTREPDVMRKRSTGTLSGDMEKLQK